MTLRGLFEKTVFFLGAGASMDAGCLSSGGMLEELEEQIKALPILNPLKKPFQGIFDFIIASLSYQNSMKISGVQYGLTNINIEDFVMVLRQLIDREYIIPPPLVGNWNNKIIGWEIQNEDVFLEFLRFVTELLINKWTKFEEDKAEELIAPFRELIQSPDDFKLDIFTLNYDVVWEHCLNSDTERLIENGFSARKWTGVFDDENYPSKLLISKLHGSIDWYFDSEAEQVLLSEEPVSEPTIIFGSSNKMQSFDPFISLLSRFRQRLQTSILYVIIGYSFQDRYINNILIQSLSSKLAGTAIVVDPSAWTSEQELVEKVELTQRAKSLNEMINLTRINPERINLVKKNAKEFYKEYLTDGAEKLKNVLEKVEEGEPAF